MPLRLTTWNVNGIRNPFGYQPWREKRTFQAMFDILEADIVVMQETKIQRKDLKDDMVLVPGWNVHFSLPKHKKGYSGVAIYTRNSKCCPIRAEEGITGTLSPPNSSTKFRDLPESQQIGGYPRASQLTGDIDEATLDSEGRCVILEFPAFVLIGTYSPANRDSSRDDFRIGYLAALDARVRNLVAAGKQVILTGDLNVIRSEIDTCNLAEMLRKENISVDDWMAAPSRRILNQLVFGGDCVGQRDDGRELPVLWDTCRRFYPDRHGMFTCWDTKRNTRPANNGSRIDYVLCSEGLINWTIDSNIQEGLHGSDHCPVYATFADELEADGKRLYLLDRMNPEGMVEEGKRIRDWSNKDLLPMSAKLIPEFDRRRSIRDMFMKKPAAKPTVANSTDASAILKDSNSGTPSAGAKELRHAGSLHDVPTLQPRLSQEMRPPDYVPISNDGVQINSESKPVTKRSAEASTPLKPAQKKAKTGENQISVKAKGGVMSQSSLASFFKPKASPKKITDGDSIAGVDRSNSSANPVSDDAEPDRPSSSGPSKQSATKTFDSSPTEGAAKVFDPIQVKETWSKLQLGQRVAPKCEHGEPCIILLTKKAGFNCGRSFYICPRPLGPSGEKEKGTDWRCSTFIWSSDWKKQQHP